jgi:ABC-type lipoprotein export system ATPase subunit
MVLVTHDPRVAAQAGRIVRLYDGLIESDGEPEPVPAHAKGGAA